MPSARNDKSFALFRHMMDELANIREARQHTSLNCISNRSSHLLQIQLHRALRYFSESYRGWGQVRNFVTGLPRYRSTACRFSSPLVRTLWKRIPFCVLLFPNFSSPLPQGGGSKSMRQFSSPSRRPSNLPILWMNRDAKRKS